MEFNPHQRQGQMDSQHAYFFTQSINGFKHLLKDDEIKMIIIDSLKHLVIKKKIKIYGYVIMPNHVHFIWEMISLNGKESPAGSFAKFTAHQFKEYLSVNHPVELYNYRSDKSDREYQFWKRDPLAIPLTSEKSFLQKLDYIHFNPVDSKWKLAGFPEIYRWSSAAFYEDGRDEFGILSDYRL